MSLPCQRSFLVNLQNFFARGQQCTQAGTDINFDIQNSGVHDFPMVFDTMQALTRSLQLRDQKLMVHSQKWIRLQVMRANMRDLMDEFRSNSNQTFTSAVIQFCALVESVINIQWQSKFGRRMVSDKSVKLRNIITSVNSQENLWFLEDSRGTYNIPDPSRHTEHLHRRGRAHLHVDVQRLQVRCVMQLLPKTSNQVDGNFSAHVIRKSGMVA